jgi:hypothetical protein
MVQWSSTFISTPLTESLRCDSGSAHRQLGVHPHLPGYEPDEQPDCSTPRRGGTFPKAARSCAVHHGSKPWFGSALVGNGDALR